MSGPRHTPLSNFVEVDDATRVGLELAERELNSLSRLAKAVGSNQITLQKAMDGQKVHPESAQRMRRWVQERYG